MSTDKGKAAKPEEGGNELFYLDENGKKQDASLHDEIMKGAEDEPGAFDDLIESLGLSEKFAETFKDKDYSPAKEKPSRSQ
jgi:hypothetical protein